MVYVSPQLAGWSSVFESFLGIFTLPDKPTVKVDGPQDGEPSWAYQEMTFVERPKPRISLFGDLLNTSTIPSLNSAVMLGQSLWAPDKLDSLLGVLMANSVLSVKTNLHQTEIPFDGAPDIDVADDARICMLFQSKEGIFSMPRMVALEGFSAWKVALTRIRVNDQGELQGGNPECIPWISLQKLFEKSPLAHLFAENKIGPLHYTKVIQALPQLSLKNNPSPKVEALMSALEIIDLQFRSLSDENTPQAKLDLLLDWKKLKSVLESGFSLKKILDSLKKLKFVYKKFPLDKLPLNLPFDVNGFVDLSVHFDEKTQILKLSLNNIEASIDFPLSDTPLKIRGAIQVAISVNPDDSINLSVDFKNLKIDSFFSAQISGNSHFKINPDQSLSSIALNLHTSLQGTHTFLQTPHSWSFASIIKGFIQKDMALQLEDFHFVFNPENLAESNPINMAGDLHGDLNIDTQKGLNWDVHGFLAASKNNSGVRFNRIESHGTTSLIPQLNQSNVTLKTDANFVYKSKTNIHIPELEMALTSNPSDPTCSPETKQAQFKLTSQNIPLAQGFLKPELNVGLTLKEQDGHTQYRINGIGKLSGYVPEAVSFSPQIDVTTDLNSYSFKFNLAQPLQIGSLTVEPGIDVVFDGKLPHPTSLVYETTHPSKSFVEKITIATPSHFSIKSQKTSIVTKARVTGEWDVRSPNPDQNFMTARGLVKGGFPSRVTIKGSKIPERINLWARTNLSRIGSDKNFLSKGDLKISSYVDLSQLKNFSGLFLKGSFTSEVQGEMAKQQFEGPLKTRFNGRVKPTSKGGVVFNFSRSPAHLSTVHLGPLTNTKSPHEVQYGASGQLQGSLQAKRSQRGIRLAGSPHLKKGEIYKIEDSDKGYLVSNLTLGAQRLLGIQNETLHCGGNQGCYVSGYIHPQNFTDNVNADGDLVKWVDFHFDRLPLTSKSQAWWLIQFLKQGFGGTKGGTKK